MIKALNVVDLPWDGETDPPVELVTLAEAKDYCRVDGAGDDSVIARLITSERRWIERYLGHALVKQRKKATYGGFRGVDLPGHEPGLRDAIVLPMGVLDAPPGGATLEDQIEAVLYQTTNAAGAVVEGGLPSDGFVVLDGSWHNLTYLRPKAGTSWPPTRGDGADLGGGHASVGGHTQRSGGAAVTVIYQAGIVVSAGDRVRVPGELLHVLLKRIAYALDNRGQPMPRALQEEFERELDAYRLFTV